MFETDAITQEALVSSEKDLLTVLHEGSEVVDLELTQWVPFVALVHKLHRCRESTGTDWFSNNIYGWPIYEDSTFLVVYNLDTVYIYRKSTLGTFRKHTSQLLEVCIDIDIAIRTPMEIKQIDYARISEYEQLYQRMTIGYIERLKTLTVSTQAHTEFKKLVHFV
jgi:hypothetical protein